jgi:hypothetical protein
MKKKKIEIWYDTHAENPFEAWDCEPELMYYTSGGLTDCSKGRIVEEIRNKMTDNMLRRHKSTICGILYGRMTYILSQGSELYDEIRNDVSDASTEDLGKICDILKIPNIQYTSRGYSQSDWADVLLVCTDKFFTDSGCSRKNSEEILKGSAELFDAWAWGDVFGFTEYEATEYVKLTREDFNNIGSKNIDEIEVEEFLEWESTDSCGGFYGRDFKTNGMLEHVSEELHDDVINYDHNKIKV